MKQTYYRAEYTAKQWQALVDKATEMGCALRYGRYGDRLEIETRAIARATDLRKWRINAHGHTGAHPRVYTSEKAAMHECERLEHETGLAWEVILINAK